MRVHPTLLCWHKPTASALDQRFCMESFQIPRDLCRQQQLPQAAQVANGAVRHQEWQAAAENAQQSADGLRQNAEKEHSIRRAGKHVIVSSHECHLCFGRNDSALGCPVRVQTRQFGCTTAAAAEIATNIACGNQESGLLFHLQQPAIIAAGILVVMLLMLLATAWIPWPGTARCLQSGLTVAESTNTALLKIGLHIAQTSCGATNLRSAGSQDCTAGRGRYFQHTSIQLCNTGPVTGITRRDDDASSQRISGRAAASSWHRQLLQRQPTPQQLQQYHKTFVVLQQPAQQQQQFSKTFAKQKWDQSRAVASARVGAAVVRNLQLAVAAAAPASGQVSAGMPYVVQASPTQAVYATAGLVPASRSSSYPAVVASTAGGPAGADTAGKGITVSTSTPVIVYNPINVSTPLEQTTVQQAGGSGLYGDSSGVKDTLLLAAALKPRIMIVPVFIGR